MRPIRINTTAFEEEDLLLVTELTNKQIIKVIEPIVLAERNYPDDPTVFYDNDMLINALCKTYPNKVSQYYDIDDIDKITI